MAAPPGLASAAAQLQRPVDPALAALVTMLGEAAAPDQQPSVMRQLGAQLASLVADGARRLAAVSPLGSGDAASPPADASRPSGRPDVPAAPAPVQPPPPSGPALTLDPRLGTIVESAEPSAPGSAGGPAGGPGDGSDQASWPTSWLPIVGSGLRRLGSRTGTFAERIDALLDEVGLTRLQLLALMIAAPLAVAFLIDVVATIVRSLG